MCGIIGGLIQQNASVETLGIDMLEQIRYRGPDAGYLHIDNEFFLGMRRLAIVNPSNGQQPVFNRNGQVVAVFNGEIYNHLELRDQLEAKGYQIREGSDAEIIPHAYEYWGLEFPRYLNGDFAIALVDRLRRKVVLVRDRFGIKPLFFTRVKNGLLFASEVKSLFVHPGVSRELDPEFLSQVFTFWTGADDSSPFVDVQQVAVSTALEIGFAGNETRRLNYWQIPYHETVPNFEGDFVEGKAEFRNQLKKSVSYRLNAEVNVGTYTSGGVDSSAINVVAFKDLDHSSRQTFSVTFADVAYDESEHQRQLTALLQLTPNQVRCDSTSIVNNLTEVIRHTESPIFRTAPIPMFLLSRLVRDRGVKVILTGEGADEVAWGYDIFREAKIRRFWSRQPDSKFRSLLFRKLYGYLPQFQNGRHFRILVDFFRQGIDETNSPVYSHHTRVANSLAIQHFLSARIKNEIERRPPVESLIESLPHDFSRRSPLERCQFLEMRTLLQGYLLSSQGDRMLSAHGVEGRFPYLDHQFVEFVAGLPERFRLRGLQDKFILRESFRNDLPAGLGQRPKFAFRAPEANSFSSGMEVVGQHLDERAILEADIFDPVAVNRLVHQLKNSNANNFSTRNNLAFVQILSTQIVHDQFVEQFNRIPGTRRDTTITYGNLNNDTRKAA